jgi:hypothetical protein
MLTTILAAPAAFAMALAGVGNGGDVAVLLLLCMQPFPAHRSWIHPCFLVSSLIDNVLRSSNV